MNYKYINIQMLSPVFLLALINCTVQYYSAGINDPTSAISAFNALKKPTRDDTKIGADLIRSGLQDFIIDHGVLKITFSQSATLTSHRIKTANISLSALITGMRRVLDHIYMPMEFVTDNHLVIIQRVVVNPSYWPLR